MSKIPKHVETAILEMPQAEKDKLLLRLVVKEPLLLQKLEHKLLGDASDTLARRNELLTQIKETASYPDYDTPGWLMMALRVESGVITRHVKITQDKTGEPLLFIALVNEAFRHQQPMLDKQAGRAENFAAYVVKKAKTALEKLRKVHPDLYVEIEEEVNQMLDFLHNYPPARNFMKQMPLPRHWKP